MDGARTVLIVGEDAGASRTARTLGFQAVVAGQLEEAVTKAKGAPPSLVLVNLPGSALEPRWLLQLSKEPCPILIVADADGRTSPRPKNGKIRTLHRPLREADLDAALRSALDPLTSGLETRLQTISQEILSRSRLEGLITRFGLYPDLRKRVSSEETIERMRSDIKLELKGVEVRGERQATVAFAISFQGSDPQTVALVTNTLASFYIEENLKVRERQATGTAEFLKVQLEQTKKRLDEQEQQVSQFKRRYLGELAQQMETNLAALERLHMQLRLNADNQTRATERRQALASQLAEAQTLLQPVYAAPGMPGPESPEMRLTRLKQELTALRAQFSEKYPDVVRAKAEIAELERQVAEAKVRRGQDGGETRSPAPGPDVAVSAAAQGGAQRGRSRGEDPQGGGKAPPGGHHDLSGPGRKRAAPGAGVTKELSRDYESTRELYLSLSKRYEEAQLAESMEQRQKGEQFRAWIRRCRTRIRQRPSGSG